MFKGSFHSFPSSIIMLSISGEKWQEKKLREMSVKQTIEEEVTRKEKFVLRKVDLMSRDHIQKSLTMQMKFTGEERYMNRKE